MPDVIVHVLRYGLPLCGFADTVPGKWPAGHQWIHYPDPSGKSTCLECQKCLPRSKEQAYQLPAELQPMTEEEVHDLLSVRLQGELPWPTVRRMLNTLAVWLEDRRPKRVDKIRTVGDLIARLRHEDPSTPVVAKAPQTKPPWAEALAVDVEHRDRTGHAWGATVVIGGKPVSEEDW